MFSYIFTIKCGKVIFSPAGASEKSNWLILRLFPGDFDNISALKDAVEGVTAVLFNVLAVTTPWHGTRGDSFKEYHQGCHCIRHSHHDHLFQCCNDGKPRNVPELGPRLPYPLAWYWQNKTQIGSNTGLFLDPHFWRISTADRLLSLCFLTWFRGEHSW